jgi:hypothetical protein
VKAAAVVARAIVDGEQAKAELRVMASLSSVADRIRAKKGVHAAKAEAWAARLDKLDKLEPDIFAATDAAIGAYETDLSGMEADMRALTNGVPPTDSQKSQGGSNG